MWVSQSVSDSDRAGALVSGNPPLAVTNLARPSERERERERERMAGLLAWAADVVGGGGPSNDEDDTNSIPVAFTPEQQQYVRELDRKSASLSRSIQDLRLRLPPPDISQRLPHLHAHSLASNAALALQLNAHSATKQQVLNRFRTLFSYWYLSVLLNSSEHGCYMIIARSDYCFFDMGL